MGTIGMLIAWLKNAYNSMNAVSVFTDIKDKLVSLYNLSSSFYAVGRQLLKTGETILSKLALSGVSVSCLTAAGFFTLLHTGVTRLLAALQSVSDGLAGAATGSASSVLSNINYYLPVDTVATVILLYVSLWVGVGTFKFWVRLLSLAFGLKSGHSKG